jgi:predicted kinase
MDRTRPKLTAMRGFSGSGKSTRAAEIARDTGAVVVNRDLLRLMLLGSFWTGKKEDEDRVTVAEQALVDSFLRSGTSVVVDATHLNPAFLRRWARMATKLGTDFEVVDVHADMYECKRRDHARMLEGGRYVGDTVIDRQTKQWPVHKWPTVTAEPPLKVLPYVPNLDLPKALILDLDGTIALHTSGRGPFEYSRVGEDSVDGVVRDLVNLHAGNGYRVIAVSGREDVCFRDTIDWLTANDIFWDELFMRKAKDFRQDAVVKYEIFDSKIRDNFNVRFAVDDRKSVVSMWRSLNMKVLDVAGNEF